MDFLTQKFVNTDIILLHPHPVMLYNALTHASQFNCKVVVVMHIWQGYPPYKKFLRGGHLPYFCTDIKLTHLHPPLQDYVTFLSAYSIYSFQGRFFFLLCFRQKEACR